MHLRTMSILILVTILSSAYAIDPKFSFNNDTLLQIELLEKQTSIVNGSLSYFIVNGSASMEEMILKCWMDVYKVGTLLNFTDTELPPATSIHTEIEFSSLVYAKRLGSSDLICSINTKHSLRKLSEVKIARLIVLRGSSVVDLIFRIFITMFVIFITFTMGCGLDLKIIWSYLKRPISPAIGFGSQFLFMPLISAGLGKLTGIENGFGFGLLIVGCSPGGGSSNVWTILFGGDLNLSMTMTFISSCAALMMMPFWLFILGRLFIEPGRIEIPYGTIGLNLLQVVIPVAVGLLFRWKWESKAKLLLRWAKFIGLAFIIFIFTFGLYVNFYIFELIGDYLYLIPVAACLPWMGMSLGFIFSLITRRDKSHSIAIALETGIQNTGIAIIVLKYSMPQPDGDLGTVIPLIVALFTPVPLYLIYIVILLRKRFYVRPDRKSQSITLAPL